MRLDHDPAAILKLQTGHGGHAPHAQRVQQPAVQPYVDFREKYNVPLWLGESGENSDEWITQFRELLEKNDIGWTFWPYKKMEKSSAIVTIVPPEGWDKIVAFAKLPRAVGSTEARLKERPEQAVIDKAFGGIGRLLWPAKASV